MNWLDRMIGWTAPKWGLQRIQARRLIATLSYDGARSGRRTEGWVTVSSSADAESQLALEPLRNRARDLVRNNPYAARAIDVKVSNTIGAGIVAEVKNKRLAKLWQAFVSDCDADRKLDLYGIQALIERCRFESGEVLLRFVALPDGPINLGLRVLEPDYLDTRRDTFQPTNDGSRINQGIEYDRYGRATAYWLFQNHPGDNFSLNLRSRSIESERVPASDVIHLYRQLRAGQTRGISDFAPVILRARDLDDYDDAELMRKKVEACLAVGVTVPGGTPSTDAARLTGSAQTDSFGKYETLMPGGFHYFEPGAEVTFMDPKASGGYADFERFGLRAIAAGTGVPYELMTGDLSQVNYSSYRAGLVDFRRRIEQDQWHLHIPRICERIYLRFQSEVAGMRGAGFGDRTEVEWTPPRFELIDPKHETEAEVLALEAGLETYPESWRRRGWTAQEQYDALESDQRERDRRALKLRGDWRTQMGSKNMPEEPDEAAA